jgi:3-hydroxyisobutyrate dehydrogenase
MADHVRRVAVLRTGTMGAPMARNLLHAGFGVRVWNRTTAKAATLAADGTRPALRPCRSSGRRRRADHDARRRSHRRRHNDRA